MFRRHNAHWVLRAIVALWLALAMPARVAADTLVVDGQFNDWAGQPNVTDPQGDGQTSNTDVVAFYWGTDPDESYLYWMMQRATPSNPNVRVYFAVYVDTDNNGQIDPNDRLVLVEYDPQQDSSNVTVAVSSGAGQPISQSSGDWGESIQEGATRCEWRVSFADLGIAAHQTISMYGGAAQNANLNNLDRVPNSGSITWTPISILDYPWLIVIVVVAIGVIWYMRGRFVWRRSSSGQ